MMGLALWVITLISAVFLVQFDQALKERVLLQLASVVKLKGVQIANEIHGLENVLQGLDPEPGGNSPFDSLHFVYSLEELSLVKPTERLDKPVHLVDISARSKAGVAELAFIHHRDSGYMIAYRKIPEILEIVVERTGLGQTGESYLVGGDSTLRTRSRFFPESNPMEIPAATEGFRRAISGDRNEDIITDYRGKKVFSAFRRVPIKELDWVLLTEIDHDEALFPLEKMKRNLIIAVLASLLFIGFIAYQVARIVVKPIEHMEEKLNDMAVGKVVPSRQTVQRKDEIGEMFNAYNTLADTLTQTISFAGEIGQGDFEASYEPMGPDDQLGKALLSMREQLKSFKEKESRLIRQSQQSLINGEENERARISQELHDGIGPLLTSLRIKVQSIDLSREAKDEVISYLDETIKETRRISNNLMPSVLRDFGVTEAIDNLVLQIKSSTNLDIEFDHYMDDESDLPESVNTALYRIAQEAFNNILKHAGASEVRVSLTIIDGWLSFFISDNGQGCDPAMIVYGSGIRNMKERVRLLNGTFNFDAKTDGTTIEIEIPLNAN